jgi:hypothetical protein
MAVLYVGDLAGSPLLAISEAYSNVINTN